MGNDLILLIACILSLGLFVGVVLLLDYLNWCRQRREFREWLEEEFGEQREGS